MHVSVFDFCAIACGPQNKDFDAVSRTLLTRIKFRLLLRLMLRAPVTTFFLFNIPRIKGVFLAYSKDSLRLESEIVI